MSNPASQSGRSQSLSIVTVCLNDLEGLMVTGEGVGKQTHPDLEWLVIDGGSTDGTVDWLQSQRDVVWISEPDRSLYDAMNKGIMRASGDYVIFMNAGDAFAGPHVLSDVSGVIASSDVPVDFLYGDSIDVLDADREFYRPARSHKLLWLGMFTQHQAMIFRRERISELRYNLNYALSGDYAFMAEYLSPERGEPVVSRVHWPICRFALGGLATRGRVGALREDHAIRREVLGLSRAAASGLFVAHWIHYLAKTYLPWLFRRFRYRH